MAGAEAAGRPVRPSVPPEMSTRPSARSVAPAMGALLPYLTRVPLSEPVLDSDGAERNGGVDEPPHAANPTTVSRSEQVRTSLVM